jgi:DNA-binding GntR family transcriptional regulator
LKDLITYSGFKAGFRLIKTETINSDEAMSDLLSIKIDSRLLHTEKHFSADDELVIIAQTFIPEWVLGDLFEQILNNNAEVTEPLLEFLENKCAQKIKNMHSSFWPDTIRGCGIKLSDFDPSTPVLVMENVAYNYDEIPIITTNQIQIGKRMSYNIIRQMENIG